LAIAAICSGSSRVWEIFLIGFLLIPPRVSRFEELSIEI